MSEAAEQLDFTGIFVVADQVKTPDGRFIVTPRETHKQLTVPECAKMLGKNTHANRMTVYSAIKRGELQVIYPNRPSDHAENPRTDSRGRALGYKVLVIAESWQKYLRERRN